MSAKSALSAIAINYFGFTMAVDYSIVLLSIQELWYSLGGSRSFFGFAFGSYALAQAIVSPLLGYLSDLRGLKFAVMLSLILNVLGNILYGFSVLAESTNMVLAGRFVAGLGAGSVPLALVYLTNTTARESRGSSVASFKLAQAIGLLGGPVLGMFLIPLFPTHTTKSHVFNDTKSVGIATVFNMYTSPIWLATGNVLLIMLPLTKFCFKNPMAPHMAMKYNFREAKVLIRHTSVLMSLLLFGTISFWGIMSDLYTLALGQYQLVTTDTDLWKVYISGGVVFVFTGIFIRCTIHKRISPAMLCILGMVLNVWGFALFLDYPTTNQRLRSGLYFGAVALATSGGAAFFTGLGTYYSQKITDFSDQARNRRGVFLGLFCCAEGLGRFVGPVVVPFFIRLRNASTGECKPEDFKPDNCIVSHANHVISILCGILFISLLLFIYYHIYHGKRRIDDFLLNNTDIPHPLQGRFAFREEGGREDEEPADNQLELSPSRVCRTSSYASSNSSIQV